MLTPEAASIAVDRLQRLIHAWLDPVIPVLRATVREASDVLEVFSRTNLGGVQVEGADVYFAAVKTFWHEAESRLDRVQLAALFLPTRMDALRLVSRLASRGLGQGDLLPLRVDRLTGRQREPLVHALQELTAQTSVVLARVGACAAWLRDNSELGYGLRLVTADLWDEVLGVGVGQQPNR
ncbi:hypothetical protein [Cryobacterium sp. N21]|uniref:hypothetical protein n=1 Tax=Cryobacterium sp. N21 TaxID=2048289 RepID=UPI000CE3EE33|nr:hypothetical protein [Cryobacterium sp. N21]